MRTFALASFITSAIVFLLGSYVYLKNRKESINKCWAAMSLSIAAWSLGQGMRAIATVKLAGLFWNWFLLQAAILIPVFFLHFIFVLVGFHRKERKGLFSAYILVFIFSMLNFTPLFTKDVIPKLSFKYYAKPGIAYFCWALFFVSCIIYTFYIMVKTYKRLSVYKRNQLRYVMVASFFGFVGGSTTFFPAFNIPVFPYGIYLFALWPLIIAYAIIKYRLMDIKVVITRAGIFLIVYAVVLGLPFYVGYETRSWFLATSFAVFFATLGPIIYRLLQRKAEDLLLAQQRHYQRILLQASGGMVREHNLNRLLKLIVYIVKRTVKIKFAAIYINDREKELYVLNAVRDARSFPDLNFAHTHPFIRFIREYREPFTYEELASSVKYYLNANLKVHLIVPSLIEDRLLGFLFLGEKLNETPYSQDDINVFKILSHQAALAIENCIFFEEFKKVQSKIFEAEKLASIGGMADGVAHQIKNRLNHFSVASGELKLEVEEFLKKHPEFTQNPEYNQTFNYIIQIADSLITNVKRTDSIIKGILSYARTTERDTFFDYFSLKEIISLSVELLQVKHQVTTVPIKEKLNSLDKIYGIKAQIIEVIYNLLDNAYEATQDFYTSLPDEEKSKYNPQITIEAKETPDNYLISVSDNGIGIKEEDRLKIFAPFFTTKSSYKPLLPPGKSGTGIGMYVVRRIIEENHKGKIWFNSKYLQGTTLYVELPKKLEA